MGIKKYVLELRDTWKDVLDHKHGINSAKAKGIFGGPVPKAIDKLDNKFDEAVKKASDHSSDFKNKLRELKETAEKAEKHFEDVSTKDKNGVRIPRRGRDEKFEKAKTKLDEAKTDLHDFFTGQHKHSAKQKKVIEAYEDLHGKLHETKNLFDGTFGLAQTEGIGEAISHNLDHMKIWEKNIRVPKPGIDRTGAVAMRASGITLGVTMGAHALLGKETRDGEQRSNTARLTELAAAVGVTGVSLVAGKAR